jgi:hypothetical protein
MTYRVIVPSFLTLVLERGELSASCPGGFTPHKRAPSTHCVKDGWVPGSVWLVEEIKSLVPAKNLTLVIQPFAIPVDHYVVISVYYVKCKPYWKMFQMRVCGWFESKLGHQLL